MKTAYITEPNLNFKWPHTTGSSDTHLAQQAYNKLFDASPQFAERIVTSVNVGNLDIAEIKEHNIFTLNDMYVEDTIDPISNELNDLITIQVKIVNAGTSLEVHKSMKVVPNNPTSLLKKDIIILIRPRLYQNITYDVGELLKDKELNSIQDLLAYAHAAQAEIETGYIVGRKLDALKRFMTYDTLKNYALQNKNLHADFKDVLILYDSMSIYPYKIKIKSSASMSILKTVYQLIKDVIAYNNTDEILLKRFGVDKQKMLNAELAIM